MPIFLDKDLLFKTAESISKLQQSMNDYINEHRDELKCNTIDQRDILGLTLLLQNGNIDISGEQIVKNMVDMVKELNNNPERIFNRIYDIFDSFDYNPEDTKNKEGLVKLLSYTIMNQGFATILIKNPEYRQQRYEKSLNGMKLFDYKVIYSATNNLYVTEELESYLLHSSRLEPIKPRPSLTYGMDQDQLELYNANNKMKNSYIKYLNGDTDYIEFDVVNYFTQIDYYFNAFKELPTADKLTHEQVEIRINEKICRDLFGSYSSQIRNEMSYAYRAATAINDQITSYTSFYINGKQLNSLLDPNLNEVDKPREATKLLTEAIRTGKPVDVAQSRYINGELDLQIIPVHFNYPTNVINIWNEREYNTRSWLRRKLSDIGIFKIKCADYKNVNKINDKNFSKRKNSIIQSFKDNSEKDILNNYQNVIDDITKSADMVNPNRNKFYGNTDKELEKETVGELLTTEEKKLEEFELDLTNTDRVLENDAIDI